MNTKSKLGEVGREDCQSVVLTIVLCLFFSGCSVSQVANSFFPIPRDINVSQVYWEFSEISAQGCPDLAGTYYISRDASRGLGSGLPTFVSKELDSGGLSDVELTISHDPTGMTFHEKSLVDEGVRKLEFSEYFGCQDGFVVRKSRPFVASGAEVARCDNIVYFEYRWFINQEGSLVTSTIQRSRCWLNRLVESSPDDFGPQVSAHARIR